MTVTGEAIDHTAVSVHELQRAWRAVQSGHFRQPPPPHAPAPHFAAGNQPGTAPSPDLRSGQPEGPTQEQRSWSPRPGERVLPVVGCAGSCGATVLAVALAESAEGDARVVDCGSATTSGLVAASDAELGVQATGWVHGTRSGVLLQRPSGVLVTPTDVTVPSPPERPVDVTVLDIGWDLGVLLACSGWLTAQVTGADPVILVTSATVPGLRRLDTALTQLEGTPVVAAVVGPPRKRWPRTVEHSLGTPTRSLVRSGRLVVVPFDHQLSIVGLDTAPLPGPLLSAAAHLLRLTADHFRKGN